METIRKRFHDLPKEKSIEKSGLPYELKAIPHPTANSQSNNFPGQPDFLVLPQFGLNLDDLKNELQRQQIHLNVDSFCFFLKTMVSIFFQFSQKNEMYNNTTYLTLFPFFFFQFRRVKRLIKIDLVHTDLKLDNIMIGLINGYDFENSYDVISFIGMNIIIFFLTFSNICIIKSIIICIDLEGAFDLRGQLTYEHVNKYSPHIAHPNYIEGREIKSRVSGSKIDDITYKTDYYSVIISVLELSGYNPSWYALKFNDDPESWRRYTSLQRNIIVRYNKQNHYQSIKLMTIFILQPELKSVLDYTPALPTAKSFAYIAIQLLTELNKNYKYSGDLYKTLNRVLDNACPAKPKLNFVSIFKEKINAEVHKLKIAAGKYGLQILSNYKHETKSRPKYTYQYA